MEFKVFVLLIALIPFASCYSDGAPVSECLSMTPQHGVDPQKTPLPYDIILSKNKIKAGESVDITIKGKSSQDTIKGLLVQARVGNTPVGSFDVSPSSQYLQLRDCGNSKGSAVTHKKITNGVPSVKFTWKSPKNLAEKVVFYFTVAQNGGTFWVAQKSNPLSVN